MTRNNQKLIVVAIILFWGIVFQKKYINEFPSHIHAWAQADRYALAIGFTRNNLNFFKPETFVLNHQFPDDWEVPSTESITAVDFPIHDYIPSIVMKITGNTSPWIFRLYILLYGFAGLFFLFQLSILLTGNFYKSVFVTIFAATSPVFIYYQCGFLPTIPSLANAIIGIYFYTRYLSNKNNKHFNLCLLFITMAALARTTFAIPLIAILGIEFLRILSSKTQIKPKIVPAFLSVSTILFFYFYNGYLREKYGSIFLNHFLPAASFNDALVILKSVIKNWGTQYFSKIHYGILALSILISIIYVARKKVKLPDTVLTISLLTGIIFLGCFAFSFLMLRQFPAHDYYFLDTFFLPIMLLLIISTILTNNGKIINYIYGIGIVAISIPLAINGVNTQKNRRVSGSWDRTTITINNFEGADKYLDSLKIPNNAKMLVIDPYAPNIPFILMNRKGYAVMSTKKETIKSSLTWDFDYVVIQNEFFLSDIYPDYPEIISKIKKIADSKKISIYKLSDTILEQALNEFLGLQDMTPVFEAIMTYDSSIQVNWEHTDSTGELSFSGTKSGVLTNKMTYGITYKTKQLPEITEKSRIMLFSSYFYHDMISRCEIVVSINEGDQNSYYKTYDLHDLLKTQNKWEKVDLMFQLPRVINKDYELGLYIWNIEKTNLFIDDFGFRLY